MAILVFGLIIFLGVHSAQIVLPGLRSRVIKKGGVGAWKLLYTGLAVIGLLLIILGYGLARHEAPLLYDPPGMLRHVALLVMLPVFPLLFATYIKGRIKQLVGHPMLLATILWAVAHLMANGSMSDLLLFGSFLIWAALDWRSVVKREGDAALQGVLRWGRNDAIAVVGGVLVYIAFVAGLHVRLFGVSPI